MSRNISAQERRQLQHVAQNNRKLNGVYWHDATWRRILEFMGAPGFPGLESGLSRLSESGNLYSHLLKVEAENIVVTGPNIPPHPVLSERYELHFPAVPPEDFGLDSHAWKTIYHDATAIENPPPELNMSVWQRDVYSHQNPLDTKYRGDMEHARPTRGVFMIDIEYKNKSNELEVIVDQANIFQKVQGVTDFIEHVLQYYGFEYLKIMTGKGFNLVAQVPSFEPEFDMVASLAGPLEDRLLFFMSNSVPQKRRLHQVSIAAERVHKGMARLGQYIANLGWNLYKQYGEGIKVTTKTHGTEPQVILDQYWLAVEASCKGIGIPGCPYLRHWYQDWKDNFEELQKTVLPLTAIPVRLPMGYNKHTLSVRNALHIRNNFEAAMEYMQGASAIIPNCSVGIRNLLADYQASPLGALHRRMNEKPNQIMNLQHEARHLPSNLAAMLFNADPALKSSNGLAKFIHALDARGWHPKDIGSMLYSAYALLNPDDKKWIRYYAIDRAANGEVERVLGEKYV